MVIVVNIYMKMYQKKNKFKHKQSEHTVLIQTDGTIKT